jgi:hypothetical protein
MTTGMKGCDGKGLGFYARRFGAVDFVHLIEIRPRFFLYENRG